MPSEFSDLPRFEAGAVPPGKRPVVTNPPSFQQERESTSFDPLSRFYEGYSPEHEFLLHLLGRPRPEQSPGFLKAAAQIDWQRLLQITPPDLTAYLGHKISESGLTGQCPAQLLREAGDARRATAARWLRLRYELQNLVREFNRHNLDFVVLKGAVLAFIAYPDSSLRSVSDVDLLARPEKLEKALKLIEDAGFRCPERFEFRNPLIIKDLVVPGEEISLPLQKPSTQALIEVHTQLESAEPFFPVPIEKVWEHIEETDWNDVRIPILDAHEFLFHLVLHLSRGHFFSLGLRPLLDVHLWVELQEKRLDWQWIKSESIRRGYSEWMYLTLKMVKDSFRTPIPREFFEQMATPPKLERLQKLAYQQIWADQRARFKVPPRIAITLSQPSIGRAISSLAKRLDPDESLDTPMIPALKISKNVRWRSVRRILRDLKVRAPAYLRALRDGTLAWSNLARAARLIRGQTEIRNILMGRAEQPEELGKTIQEKGTA